MSKNKRSKEYWERKNARRAERRASMPKKPKLTEEEKIAAGVYITHPSILEVEVTTPEHLPPWNSFELPAEASFAVDRRVAA